MLRQLSLLSVLAFASLSVVANDLYLDLNPDAVHARFDATNKEDIDISFAAMFADENNIDANIFSAGVWSKGRLSKTQNLKGGLGVKVYHVDTDFEDFQALSLGGNLSMNIEQVEGLRVSFELFYAPEITISDDVDNIIDINLRVHYQLFENASLYGGFRNFEAEADNGVDFDISDGPIVGIQLSL